ncbi:MAG: hypothetical protein NPIRA02_07760 [Nitrospirales bacterium]|nr:MAG: hypothetical protein NPIRA02_07760 [Nitrospirales bacterium]
MKRLRFILIVVIFGMWGCSSATYIRATVMDNPLDHVAQEAQENWTVEQVDTNTLHLSDAWPIHSIFALGYSASHANLFYDRVNAELNIQYYFQSNQLLTLFIPFTLDAEPGFTGGALKPIMNEQIADILKWSSSSVILRRAGEKSEPFPPKHSPTLTKDP